MQRRQTTRRQWLVIVSDTAPRLAAAWRLQRGSGILVVGRIAPGTERALRLLARQRGLAFVKETDGNAARVHNLPELRSALLRRTKLILLSPIFPTTSHPAWTPLPRMRAAAFARLAGRRLIALGGMNRARYARVERLGFVGWAGISAFRT